MVEHELGATHHYDSVLFFNKKVKKKKIKQYLLTAIVIMNPCGLNRAQVRDYWKHGCLNVVPIQIQIYSEQYL